MHQTVLLFLIQDDQVLLGLKKTGHGQGHVNAVGGKIEPDEDAETAVIRECQEEIGVTPNGPEKVADLTFHKQAKDGSSIHCQVYVGYDWEGEPIESEEIAPEWFFVDMVPYKQMWPSDVLWLPHVLEGKCIVGNFMFDANQELVNHEFSVANPEDLP